MANLHYYLKNPKSTGKTAVFLSIISNGKRLKYYTGKSIESKFWDSENQKAIKVKHAPEFNTNLDSIKNTADKAANRLESELLTEPTPELIRDELDKIYNPTPKPIVKNFIQFFEHFIIQAKSRTNERTGKPIAKISIRMLQQTLNVLNDYQTKKKKKIDFNTIDLDFYIDFKTFLEIDRRLSNNSIGSHIRRLKTVLNDATLTGLNTNLKYKGKRFMTISETVNNTYLNESELLELQKLNLSKNPRLEKVRDLFLIGCWTGLRFSDFTRLNNATIEKDKQDNIYFNIETQKTGAIVTIPILPRLIPILDLYGGVEKLSLPKGISNQKMNEYLKELAQMVDSLNVPFHKERTKAGLKFSTQKMKWEYISTHTARRSFATNMFERGNIPVSLIMAITGHKTEQEFYKYIQMKPKDKAELFRKLFFESKPLKVAQ